MSKKAPNSTNEFTLHDHRGVVTIADTNDIHHVYLGWNAAPRYVARAVVRTLDYVWLPRFEASEWVAAFIAAAKPLSHFISSDRPSPFGVVRLTQDWRSHDDLSFRYLVTSKKRALWIVALSRDDADSEVYSLQFEGNLDEFCAYAGIDPEEPHLVARPSRQPTAPGAAASSTSYPDLPPKSDATDESFHGSTRLPITVDELVNLLEGVDLHAEVRIGVLRTSSRQMRIAGIRTSFSTKPPDTWRPAKTVWIIAGDDLGEIPIGS